VILLTVLIAVYAGDNPRFLYDALTSLKNQTVLPYAVVLVADGPLTQEHDRVITDFVIPLSIHRVDLPVNRGLASALNAGLEYVKTEWVMRFDSDDICLPHRVEFQMRFAAAGGVDVFGAQIMEFGKNPADAIVTRKVPCDSEQIIKFAKKRNPMNHMTVCFKTMLVKKMGGYPSLPLMEDYALWVTLIAAGARFANAPDFLVYARVGNGMLARRGGLNYVKSEVQLQRLLLKSKIKSFPEALIDGFLRSLVFLAPLGIRGWFYRKFLRKSVNAPMY